MMTNIKNTPKIIWENLLDQAPKTGINYEKRLSSMSNQIRSAFDRIDFVPILENYRDAFYKLGVKSYISNLGEEINDELSIQPELDTSYLEEMDKNLTEFQKKNNFLAKSAGISFTNTVIRDDMQVHLNRDPEAPLITQKAVLITTYLENWKKFIEFLKNIDEKTLSSKGRTSLDILFKYFDFLNDKKIINNPNDSFFEFLKHKNEILSEYERLNTNRYTAKDMNELINSIKNGYYYEYMSYIRSPIVGLLNINHFDDKRLEHQFSIYRNFFKTWYDDVFENEEQMWEFTKWYYIDDTLPSIIELSKNKKAASFFLRVLSIYVKFLLIIRGAKIGSGNDVNKKEILQDIDNTLSVLRDLVNVKLQDPDENNKDWMRNFLESIRKHMLE